MMKLSKVFPFLMGFCFLILLTIVEVKSDGVAKSEKNSPRDRATSKKTILKKTDFYFNYKIISPLEIWKRSKDNNYFFSSIIGKSSVDKGKETGLLVQNIKNNSPRHSLYFNKTQPYEVFPSSQICSTGKKSVILFNAHGELIFSEDGSSFSKLSSIFPARAALASRPIEISLGEGSKALLLITQSFKPFLKKSKNAVDLVNPHNGNSINGFPLNLPHGPSSHPAIYDSLNKTAYLFSASKVLYAINLTNGKILDHFPIVINSKSKLSHIKLSLDSRSGILYISHRENNLIAIDVKTGKIKKIEFPRGTIVDAVFVSFNKVYFVEARNNVLAQVSKSKKMKIVKNFHVPEGSYTYQSTVFNHSKANFIAILSIPDWANVSKTTHDLYQKFSSKFEKDKLKSILRKIMTARFGTDNMDDLTEEQKKTIREDELAMKKSYLENTITSKKLNKLFNEKNSFVNIHVLKDYKNSIKAIISNDKIQEYTYLSDSDFYQDLCPSIYINNDSVLLGIPLNKEDGSFKSMVRVYNLK